ncbi:MAG: DUF3343 domain-containing protein [Clostridia bacterium]|nr:DUF3343 domain-containing protein [Clostridia bacterium]
MRYRYFALSSLTYAYKAQDALDRSGIKSKVIRLSGRETDKGCRYGVEVYDAEYKYAKEALYASGLPFKET